MPLYQSMARPRCWRSEREKHQEHVGTLRGKPAAWRGETTSKIVARRQSPQRRKTPVTPYRKRGVVFADIEMGRRAFVATKQKNRAGHTPARVARDDEPGSQTLGRLGMGKRAARVTTSSLILRDTL